MKIWTIKEEAERLSSRFEGVNRAAFARDYQVAGGQSMIYQHITGRRPIGIDAAQAYARGFQCKLEEISPRLAEEARKALSFGGTESRVSMDEVERHPETLTPEQQQILSLMESIDPEDRKAWLKVGSSLAKSHKSIVNDALTDKTVDTKQAQQIELKSSPDRAKKKDSAFRTFKAPELLKVPGTSRGDGKKTPKEEKK